MKNPRIIFGDSDQQLEFNNSEKVYWSTVFSHSIEIKSCRILECIDNLNRIFQGNIQIVHLHQNVHCLKKYRK